MAYLIDTHVLLWSAQDSPKLRPSTREVLADRSNEVLFSVASIWEIVIKVALDRPDLRVDPDRLREGALRAGYGELPIRGRHVLKVAGLPPIHKDPFDRILLAQAVAEGVTLLTADARLLGYGPPAAPA